jgi:hypothetical protein
MTMPRDELPFCECHWLERAAHDPHCPIEFDAELNEYNLKTSQGSLMRIYHCPFCAGRAPKSLRAQLFATVSHEETNRLYQLTKDCKTEEDVRAHLGEPSHVLDPGAGTVGPEKEGEPSEIRMCKTLRYENQSETATINVNVGRHGNVSISFFGKYIGRPKKA